LYKLIFLKSLINVITSVYILTIFSFAGVQHIFDLYQYCIILD